MFWTNKNVVETICLRIRITIIDDGVIINPSSFTSMFTFVTSRNITISIIIVAIVIVYAVAVNIIITRKKRSFLLLVTGMVLMCNGDPLPGYCTL